MTRSVGFVLQGHEVPLTSYQARADRQDQVTIGLRARPGREGEPEQQRQQREIEQRERNRGNALHDRQSAGSEQRPDPDDPDSEPDSAHDDQSIDHVGGVSVRRPRARQVDQGTEQIPISDERGDVGQFAINRRMVAQQGRDRRQCRADEKQDETLEQKFEVSIDLRSVESVSTPHCYGGRRDQHVPGSQLGDLARKGEEGDPRDREGRYQQLGRPARSKTSGQPPDSHRWFHMSLLSASWGPKFRDKQDKRIALSMPVPAPIGLYRAGVSAPRRACPSGARSQEGGLAALRGCRAPRPLRSLAPKWRSRTTPRTAPGSRST